MRTWRIFLCTVLLGLALSVTAYADDSASFVGPENIYPREVFELQVLVDGADVTRITFELGIDLAEFEVQSMWAEDPSVWQVGTDMRGYYAQRIKPGSPGEQVAITFQIRLRSVPEGDHVRLAFQNIVLWYGESSKPLGDFNWDREVARVVSDDDYLVSLSISDAALSPVFSPSVQSYTATVAHHVGQVRVQATARDANATVIVDSPELAYGIPTAVTVTVTAANGSQRVYTIMVTREDAPDRIPSNNCDLESLEVKGFPLSPLFDPQITDYVIWLPYEVTSLEITAAAADQRATVTVAGNKGFKAGQDNPIYVTCTAEDGTQKIYVVTAKRAQQHIPEASSGAMMPSQGVVSTTGGEAPVWVYIVLAVAAVTGSVAVGILIKDRKK